jgi:hypothetical protein
LHGLPISLKDQICIKGLETTMGYVSWIGQYAKRNAVLVDILEAAGAVLYVRTNVPQTLMVCVWLPVHKALEIIDMAMAVARNFQQRLWKNFQSLQPLSYLRRVIWG